MLSKKEEITYFVVLAVVVPLIIAGITPYFMSHNMRILSEEPSNGIPVINVKVKVPQPTLIIKVNGETKVRMKDPFTKYAGYIITLMYGGKPTDVWSNTQGGVEAYLYNTTFTDLWNAQIAYSPNITLTTYSYEISDNGTALIANITFTGLAPNAVNISAIALYTKTYNPYATPTTYYNHITIATNLATPLSLNVNDSIVVQWIITAPYDNIYTRTAMNTFLSSLFVKGTKIPSVNLPSDTILTTMYISNGTSSVASSTQNVVVNADIPSHAYVELLQYFETSVQNPTYLSIQSGGYTTRTVFNETIAGLGADRAVLLKIDVSFG